MGTDIHGYIEVLRREGDWIAVAPVNPSRNYTWFSVIAGIRGHAEWSKPAPWHRGMPVDPSCAWKEYVGPNPIDSGLHSLTWLTLPEIIWANEMWGEEMRYKFTGEDGRTLSGHQSVPTKDTPVNILYMGHVNNDDVQYQQISSITIPWLGTVDDMRDKTLPFDKTVRMVVGFDS